MAETKKKSSQRDEISPQLAQSIMAAAAKSVTPVTTMEAASFPPPFNDVL
jgi:hypothetical protein